MGLRKRSRRIGAWIRKGLVKSGHNLSSRAVRDKEIFAGAELELELRNRSGPGSGYFCRILIRMWFQEPSRKKGLAEADLEQELLIQIRVLWSDPRNFVGSTVLKSSDMDTVVQKSDPDSNLV